MEPIKDIIVGLDMSEMDKTLIEFSAWVAQPHMAALMMTRPLFQDGSANFCRQLIWEKTGKSSMPGVSAMPATG